MELAMIILVGVVFTIVGAVCVVTVVLGLPGTWMMLGLAVAIELLDGVYLSEGNETTFGWLLLGICAVAAVVGELLEFLAGALGAKQGGSSRRGMIGAVIGGLVGAIVGAPFGLLIGALVGAMLGSFVGAMVGELTHADTGGISSTLKPATGAMVGRVLGTLSKVPIAMLVWLALSVAAFWP